MIEYAGIEFANSSSQWEVRACFPDQKEAGQEPFLTHREPDQAENIKQNFMKKKHLINIKPAATLFEA